MIDQVEEEDKCEVHGNAKSSKVALYETLPYLPKDEENEGCRPT